MGGGGGGARGGSYGAPYKPGGSWVEHVGRAEQTVVLSAKSHGFTKKL